MSSSNGGLIVNGKQIIDKYGNFVIPIEANTPPPILMMSSSFPV